MIDLFLKAKHWQFFLLSYALPMIAQFILMNEVMTNTINNQDIDPSHIFSQFWWIPLFAFLFMFILLGWQWAVVIGLNEKIDKEIRFGITRFKIFFFLPIVYFIVIGLGMTYFMTNIIPGLLAENIAPNLAEIGTWAIIIIPLHFLAMFCMFHTMYFVAKTIKTSELQRKTSFSDFVGDFFLIWFFPIGIWILQPRINDIINGKKEDVLFDQIIE